MPATEQSMEVVRRRSSDPRFLELRRRRRRLSDGLSAVMCVLYFGYLLAASLAPALMAWQVAPSMTLGMLAGIFVILSAVVLTAVYNRSANRSLDPLVDALHKDAS